jgi:hypothetical protein
VSYLLSREWYTLARVILSAWNREGFQFIFSSSYKSVEYNEAISFLKLGIYRTKRKKILLYVYVIESHYYRACYKFIIIPFRRSVSPPVGLIKNILACDVFEETKKNFTFNRMTLRLVEMSWRDNQQQNIPSIWSSSDKSFRENVHWMQRNREK